MKLPFNLTEEDLNYESRIDKQAPRFVYVYLSSIRSHLIGLTQDLDWNKCISQSEILIDYSWEMLNTNIWVFVDERWRLLYAYSTLFKILCLKMQEERVDDDSLVKLCDLGLLMSGPLLEAQFDKILTFINSNQIENKSKKIKIDDDKIITTVKLYPTLNSEFLLKVEDSPSIEIFDSSYYSKRVPVIIDNQMTHWPAIEKWSIDYIIDTAGNRTVPVEIGSKYTDADWSQRLMTIREFIQEFILIDESSKTKGYLAQHPLFDQIPELKNDIYVPEYCLYLSQEDTEESNVDINAWFGPEGTVSPLHYDPKHNFLCQVIGEKYVRLYDEKYSDRLYANEGNILRNTSRIDDIENLNADKYPLTCDVPYWEGILKPGQMLYIPPRCWHYIRSLSLSFSVSFWWN